MNDTIDLQKAVDEALDCAVFENCHTDLMSHDAEEIAKDLMKYDRHFETCTGTGEELVPHVQSYLEWFFAQRKGGGP